MNPFERWLEGWTEQQIIGAVGLLVFAGLLLGLIVTARRKGK